MDQKPNEPIRANSTPPTTFPAKNHFNIKKLLPLVIAGVLLLLIGAGLVIAASGDKKDSVNNKNNSQQVTIQPEDGNDESFSATQLADLNKVCEGGAAINTTDYNSGPSPHPIMLFTPSNQDEDKLIEEIIVFTEKGWRPLYSNVEATQLVGCFKRSNVGISKKCEIKSGGQLIAVDFFPVDYELTVRESKTGKSLGTKKVNGFPNESCPFLPDFNKEDPKMYGTPHDSHAQEALREFVTR